MVHNIAVYRGLEKTDRHRLLEDISAAYAQAAKLSQSTDKETGGPATAELVEIPEFSDLVDIDPSVYRQINAALKAGKRHLMFYGPPGTGKTTLSQLVARTLHGSYTMITGSADWTSQDVDRRLSAGRGRKDSVYPGRLTSEFRPASDH